MMRLELGPQRDANRQVPLVRCPSIAVVCEKILEDPCLNCLENGGLEHRAFRKNWTKPQVETTPIPGFCVWTRILLVAFCG